MSRFAVTTARADLGVQAQQVAVEVHLGGGLSSFSIVGLPEAVVKESRHRVRSAIQMSHFKFPTGRITVNLAPAELPKEGGRYDLAIALGILAASKQIPPQSLNGYEFGAELALTGELRDFYSVIPMTVAATKVNNALFFAPADAKVAARVVDAVIFTASTLLEVCQHLTGVTPLTPLPCATGAKVAAVFPDLADVEGQYQAKRALEIAAAGGHSLLMIGSPGVGKTMLASRLPGILPPLSDHEALEIMTLHALVRDSIIVEMDFSQRPFRAPHHSASSVALIGGGRLPKPGEVSLAHNGVLFLDELPEFNRAGLEALRQPLESGVVNISRAAYTIQYPANFQLIAAMNPCPCGYALLDQERCRCSVDRINRYQNKISGPLLDRIDLQVQMADIKASLRLTAQRQPAETSAVVQKRVLQARVRQIERQTNLNAKLSQAQIKQHAMLSTKDEEYFAVALENFGLSLRAYYRLVKVARTIADLAECPTIQKEHLQEALMFRKLEQRLPQTSNNRG